MPTILKTISALWTRANINQKVVLVTVLFIFLGSAALLVNWATKPEMALLYSDLSPDEAGKIVEKISERDIPFELKSGGTTIYVPRERVSELRLSMAVAGLPASGQGGYRILDESKLGMTPFAEQINYVRAIEGELASSISLLENVISARVHIAKAQKKLFQDKTSQTSATVVLSIKSGARLPHRNVSSIVHMLSGAVEGLAPERVVVVDNRGTLLSGEEQSQFDRGIGTLLDIKTQTENYLAQKAKKMLEQALGAGKCSIEVDVIIETSNLVTTSEEYDPTKKVVTSEEIKTKTETSATGQKQSAGSPGSSVQEDIKTEYATSKTIKQISQMPGVIKSRSVAAIVDLSGQKSEGGKSVLTIKDVEGIIRHATGLGTTDSLSVIDTPMQSQVLVGMDEPPVEGFLGKISILDLAKQLSLGLLVIGALLVLKMFASPKKNNKSADQLGNELEGDLQGTKSISKADTETMRRRIASALQDNPAEVKRLFLNWVNNGKGN